MVGLQRQIAPVEMELADVVTMSLDFSQKGLGGPVLCHVDGQQPHSPHQSPNVSIR